jgi:TonB-linked SusC/RagA family outer membrane protein
MLVTCIFLFQISFAQKRTVTGVVTDENGSPLAGASVSVEGAKGATTITGTLGKFTLNVSPDAKALVFSFIGMQAQTVSIGKGLLKVSLKPVSTALNDVVVIGFGTERRSHIASSISSISEKDIKNIPAAGADQLLQGKVAGVTVTTNSGQPGGGVSVRVRGVTTVSNLSGVTNEPLYVIDGVPIVTSTTSTGQDQLGGVAGQTTQSVLATLNSSDIASMDILKDASAQAIYGAAGANGVILITTKKGKSGEGKLAYDVYYGWQNVQKKLPIMNLPQYAQYYNSVVGEGTVSGLDTIGEFKNPSLLGAGTNWQDAVFQQGNIQNHQLSFSGGQGKTTYYLSGNYFDQTGTVIGSGFKRYAFRTNIDQQVKSWLKAGISANMSRTQQQITLTDGQQSVISLALYNSPATPVKGFDGSYISTAAIAGVPFGNTQNPVALAMLRDVHGIQSKVFGGVYAEIQFLPGLTLRNQFNYDYQSIQNTAFQPNIVNPDNGQLVIGPNRLREERDNSLYYGLQSYLTYSRTFGKHYINAVAGHEFSVSNYDSKYISVTGTTLNMESIGAGTLDPSQTSGASYPGASEGYFARLNYTYDNKYSLSASERRDGSSSFGQDKRIGYFPAISAAWTVTNENFTKKWKDISVLKEIDFLKLRVGVGSAGYSNTGGNNAYTTNIRLISALNGLFGQTDVTGFVANAGNPDLHWQSVNTYNAGLDVSLINRHIDLTLDVYKKVTTDMILSTSLPSFAGLDINPNGSSGPLEGGYQNVDPPVVNAGKMTNTGIDIGITTHNIATKDFTWNSNIVFSHYKNVLNKLNSQQAALYGYSQTFTPGILTVSQPGAPVGQFYGYKTDGLYRTMSDLTNGPVTPLPIGAQQTWLGDIRYKDVDKNDTINSNDQTFIGDPNPKFTYGFTNTFTYKGFDLSIFLTGVYGDKIYNYTRMETEANFDVYENQLTTVMNRYTASNPKGSLPRYNQWNNNNLAISDRFVESGSYLRIQNVSLGYNLPQKLISKVKISSARVYISGQNLHTFTKYSGYDPELGSFNGNALTTNIDYGHYPNPRSFTIGANIEF